MPGQAIITSVAEDGVQNTYNVNNISEFRIYPDRNIISLFQGAASQDFDTKNNSSISISIINGVYYATIS